LGLLAARCSLLAGRVVVIAHAPRGNHTTRILSMRKAITVSKKSIKSDLARVDRMKDAEIDYSDIPPLDKSFYTKATEAWPRPNSNSPFALTPMF
jgi:hypothetical protein